MDGVYRKYSLEQLQANVQAIMQKEQKICVDLLCGFVEVQNVQESW
jgi:hypothetical protein